MPELYGSVTPSAAAAAIAASTALPPLRSTRSPIRVASGSTVLIAPPRPMLVATLRGGLALDVAWTAAGVAARATAGPAPAGVNPELIRAGVVELTIATASATGIRDRIGVLVPSFLLSLTRLFAVRW